MQDHEARVTGLALLKNKMLASISYDRSIRIWDLTTMKPVAVSGEGGGERASQGAENMRGNSEGSRRNADEGTSTAQSG